MRHAQRTGWLLWTKKTKSRHRIPTFVLQNALAPDPISERYQIEVDMATNRLERRYRKAQRALEVAERKAEAARIALQRNQSDRAARAYHQQLLELVETRRAELREIEALMMPSDYGRDRTRRTVRHENGEIHIPLGETAAMQSAG